MHLRIADHEGTIYVDTGRPDGQVIRIVQGRWADTNTTPVRFLRTKLTGAMPLPPPDSEVMRLWDFVNVDAEDRPVLLAVPVAALIQCDVRIRCWRSSQSKAARRARPHACWSFSSTPPPFPFGRRHATPLVGDRRVRVVGGRLGQLICDPAVAVGFVMASRHW